VKKCYSYNKALKQTIDLLKNRQVDLSLKHVVIVPEKYTLLVEEAIFEYSSGAFDIEVISFNRLYQKLLGEFCLSKEGAIVVIKKILYKNKLQVYEKTKNFSGAASKLYKEISTLILSNISIKKLNNMIDNVNGALKLKMQDIKLVYEQFLNETKDIIVDRHGKLLALNQTLKTNNYFSNAHTYILNFDYKTVLEQLIFKTIKKNSVSFFDTQDIKLNESINTKTEIYAAANSISAIKAAAKRIRQANFEGAKFKDMGVVCDSGSFDGIKRIFSEFNIPFYIDQKPKLRDNIISKYILTLLDLKRVNKSSFFKLAKNELCNIEIDDINVFENYCDKYLIEYKGFYQEFEDETAERVRKKLVKTRDSFWDRDIKNLLDGILDKESDSKRIRELFDLSLNASENKDFILETFKENLISSVSSSIAYVSDAVIISDAAAFRGTNLKKAFILDFNEGVIPAPEKPEGIFSNSELKNLGMDLANLAIQKQQSKIKDILSFMHDSDQLFIAYTKNDEKRPSPLLSSLDFVNINFNSETKERALLSNKDMHFLGNKSSALEYLLLNINKEITLPFIGELYQILKTEADKFLFNNKQETTKDKDFFDKLFFKAGKTSASQLEEFYRCPFRHFVKYGLKAKEIRGGEVDLLDAGNLIHKIAQEFVSSNFCEETLKTQLKMPFASYKFDLSENEGKKERLINIIQKLALRFKEYIRAGSFALMGTEMDIGGIEIEGLKLIGKVDYADEVDIDNNKFIRIIDYKSGRAKFVKNEVIKGEKLQLALYVLSFLQEGYKFGGIFYYPFKSRWADKDNKFSGILVKNDRVIDSMGGERVIDLKEAKSEIEIETLLNGAVDAASDMIKRIRAGQIKKEASKDSVCKYCKYCFGD